MAKWIEIGHGKLKAESSNDVIVELGGEGAQCH
jgi:hypothetical protein